MKLNPSIISILLISAITLGGCSHHQVYSGSKKPREQVARIQTWHKFSILDELGDGAIDSILGNEPEFRKQEKCRIVEVNGTKIPDGSGAEVLPGYCIVLVYSEVLEPSSHNSNTATHYIFDTGKLEFVAEAGEVYVVRCEFSYDYKHCEFEIKREREIYDSKSPNIAATKSELADRYTKVKGADDSWYDHDTW